MPPPPPLHISYTGGIVKQHGVDDPGAMEIVDRDAIAKSQKEVLKLYGRAVDVLRDKRERELLAEALCDVGDLHVSEHSM